MAPTRRAGVSVRALLTAAGVLTAITLLACGGGEGEKSAVGVVIDVQAAALTEIDSFTLRTNEGETLMFRVAPDARPNPEEGFVPGHLRSHASLAEQVEVFYREENGELLALRLVDR